MKLRSLFFGTLCMLMLGVSFTSCSDDDDDSKMMNEGSIWHFWQYSLTITKSVCIIHLFLI